MPARRVPASIDPSQPRLASTTLLDPGFARELEALRRRMAVRARSGQGGEHVAKRRGSSAEFLEHRPYAPGDDLRRMDWLAFARTGEPVLKQFRAEEDVIVRLVLDASASLGEGTPPKIETAKKLAAAVGYMALAASERAQVMVAGEGLARVREPSRGRGALPRLLSDLDDIERTGGGTDLAKSIEEAVMRSDRPGMLVVLSDFLDPGGFDGAVARAAAEGHDVALVQVLAPEEIAPTLDGDFALEDAETGALVEVTVDGHALDAYVARLNALLLALRALAKRHRATYVRATTTDPILATIRRFVARSVD
jgi:uncharacterized protein (DUF58 family)